MTIYVTDGGTTWCQRRRGMVSQGVSTSQKTSMEMPHFGTKFNCIPRGLCLYGCKYWEWTKTTGKRDASSSVWTVVGLQAQRSQNHHPALLHHHTLIMDHLLTFLMTFSTLVFKLSFSQSLSLHSCLSLPQADLLELWPLVVWQSLAVVVLVSVTY